MRAGISTASLFLKRENIEALALLEKWKIPTAEVFLTSFSEYNKKFGEKLKGAQGQVNVNSIHDLTEQFEPQLYGRHPKVKRDAFQMLAGVLEVGKLLGAKYYTFHGVSRIKRSRSYDNFDFFAPVTREIYDFCQTYGITLAYETVEWALYNRPGIFTRLKEDCPGLRGVLDVKQTRISGYNYREYITDMGSALAYVHYTDVDENGKTCLAGKGIFDLEEMLQVLADNGFDGDILLENYADDYQKEEELLRSYEYLSEKIYKLGL